MPIINFFKKNCYLSLISIIFIFSAQLGFALPQNNIEQRLVAIIRQLPKHSSAIVFNLEDNANVLQHNPDLLVKPASILKVLTTYAALQKLGPEFTFETKVIGTPIKANHVNTVSIVGGGDPGFRIEELTLLIRRLKLLGIKSIDTVNLDSSRYFDKLDRVGSRAYEAASSALAFNFNTVRIQVCPTQIGKAAHVVVDPFEYETKLQGQITTVAGQINTYSIDEATDAYKISGKIGIRRICHDHYRAVGDVQQYLAEVLAKQLALYGIAAKKITNGVSSNLIPIPAWTFSLDSKNLNTIITDLNHFSSNFTAEQIVYALGADSSEIMNRTAGLNYIRATAEQLLRDAAEKNINIADGSGLSHDNRITARLILAVLKEFWKTKSLKVEFERSLPVLGRSGTLKTRPKLGSTVVRAKTGSINGVSSLAGYIYTEEKPVMAFVLIQNGSLNRNQFIKLEQNFLEQLVQ